ncbi:MAG: MG2 domain-containing protein, partial [Desulfatirhabdiaceae bacterium]|nr:MG2 domain-containing protein [Desulfatirhabdiaceae bacterium]
MKRIRFLSLMLAMVLSLPVIAASPALAGSPFYLTVERSFSHTEKPQVRLDYTSTEKPMLVRILRPENLERFLDGQFQISRSYEQPVTELNPGHFFVSGLNKMESPLKTARNMLDPKFRATFKDTALSKAILDTTPGQIALPPEEIVQGPPAGFAVVRDMFIDLKYMGTAVNDLGWWFGEKAWREDRYKIRKIELDPLPDGVYLIQAVQGKAEAQCLMQVSSLSVQVKQSTEQLIVRVIDRQLNPISGAGVSFRDGRGKWIGLNKKTDPAGEISYASRQVALDGKLVIKVDTPDGRQALVDTDFLPTVSNDDSVFIITDRPIFKPGETFFYKGMIRAFEKGGLKVPQFGDNQAKVSLIPFSGAATDLQAAVPLTAFGSFSGSFDLDSGQAPGLYRLIAEIGAKPYGGEFRVRDYVKPTFYLELIDRSPTVASGGRFFVKFRAKRYSGGVPYNLKYEVFLYRKK